MILMVVVVFVHAMSFVFVFIVVVDGLIDVFMDGLIACTFVLLMYC